MKANKSFFILNSIILGLNLSVFLLLFLPLVNVTIQENIYIYKILSFSGYDIIKGDALTNIHQVVSILLIIFNGFLVIANVCSLILKKNYFLIKKILLFVTITCSFFFLCHYNFWGFIVEIIILSPLMFIFILQSREQKEKNANLLFKNVIFSFVLMFAMLLILGLDTFSFAII